MSVELMLPRPNQDELVLGMKQQYFTRIIGGDWAKKYKLTQDELCLWIHHNYQNIFLYDKPINLQQLKKL